MSTPLNVAIDIVTAVARAKAASQPLDIGSLAREIQMRHRGTGFSRRTIAAALSQEGMAAGTRLIEGRQQFE
jgi:hypothetical protein